MYKRTITNQLVQQVLMIESLSMKDKSFNLSRLKKGFLCFKAMHTNFY